MPELDTFTLYDKPVDEMSSEERQAAILKLRTIRLPTGTIVKKTSAKKKKSSAEAEVLAMAKAFYESKKKEKEEKS